MTIFIPKKAIPEIRLAHLYPQHFGVRRAKKAISHSERARFGARLSPFHGPKEPISHPERAHFARQYAADRIIVLAQTPYYQHLIQNPSKLAYLPTNTVSPANSSKMEHHILTFHRLPCRSRQLREPQSTHPYPSPRAAGSNSPTAAYFTTAERLQRDRNAKKIKI